MGSIRNSILLSLLLVGLASPVLCRSLEEFNEKKNFFLFPTPPASSGTPPTYGTGGGHSTPTPTYGTGGGHGTSTPSTPSYGTGGGHGTTPSYSTGGGHSTPTPAYGSGSHGSTTPTYGSGGNHATPTPSHGSGSYSPPNTGSGSGSHSTPTVPSIDPHHFFTGTCDYWRTHPQQIYAIIGSWNTIGQTFGPTCGIIFGTGTTLHDALANARTDSFGSLIREGTAALLNSMSNSHFPFTTQQVKDAVVSCISSEGAAAAQADLFKQANEGRYHP